MWFSNISPSIELTLKVASEFTGKMHKTMLFVSATMLLLYFPTAESLPIWQYFTGSDYNEEGDVSKSIGMENDQMNEDTSKPLLRYDNVVPILQVILTPIGRVLWPSVEQWFSGLFDAYLDSANRAIDMLSQYTAENISFQTGDVYYSKRGLVDGHGYQSLIITLPSGRTITVLTMKTRNKIKEFSQIAETQNEVRELV